MNTLKGWITLTVLVSTLFLSVPNAQAGIIVTGRDACTDTPPEKTETKTDDFGVIVTGLTGIIVTGFTGIIVTGFAPEPTVSCGIIVTG